MDEHRAPRSPTGCEPGDKLVYGHIATIRRYQVRSELLAELVAMNDFDDDAEITGPEVYRLAVGDVVVLGDGTTWSLAPVGVAAVHVQPTDQINDGRSWSDVLDDTIAEWIDRLTKPLAELTDDGWIWRPSHEAKERFP